MDGVLVAEKRLRRLKTDAAAYLFLGGNSMKNKKLVVAVIALVLVVGLMLGISMANKPQAVEGGKNVTVVIVYEDGTEKKL